MVNEEAYRKIHPREYLKRFIDKDVRPDGRTLSTARVFKLTTSSISTAVGSALVRLGSTTVLAGVAATLVRPDHANPEKGIVSVSVELLSTSCGESRNVRADDALVLTEFLRTLISPHIDLSKLCVEPGKLAWNLTLTVYCVDHDGNLEDSVVLAAVAAFRDVRLPTVRMTDEQSNGVEKESDNDLMKTEDEVEENASVVAVVSARRTESLELDSFPLTVSFQIFCEKALIDPSAEEEKVCTSRVTIVMRPSGELKGILKPGGHNLSEELCKSCIRRSKKRVAEYMKVLGPCG
ncbi:3' exoribonuclease [Gracilaria domingensis]|nr:3' exoribonuclease [Gracilaria domingensis]